MFKVKFVFNDGISQEIPNEFTAEQAKHYVGFFLVEGNPDIERIEIFKVR